MTTPQRTIRIRLGRGYDAVVGDGVLATLGELLRNAAPRARAAFLAIDDRLPPSLPDMARSSVEAAGLAVFSHPVRASEKDKSLAQAGMMLERMAAAGLDRADTAICLGGGIAGDLAGFAGATYRRGISVIQCPTTLLAMVDAAVGGKTGVNLSVAKPDGGSDLLKNMAGAFHQPALVLADVRALDSLPDRHLRCGLAECIKHALIGGHAGQRDLLPWTEGIVGRVLARDAAALVELIARNIQVKAAIAGDDEREEHASAGRALLNLGHTFGHAIETLPTVSPDENPSNAPLQHGEAVGLGLLAAATCAARLGRCEPGLPERVAALIQAAGLPTRVGGLPDGAEILRLMRQDKKVLGGILRLVLPAAEGTAEVVANPPTEAVLAGLDAIRA